MGKMETYEKGSRLLLSDNFRVSEFACHGRGCCDTVLIDRALIDALQKLREHFGRPVTVNSGYRCQTHNQNVGGAAGSRHTKGQAADIAVEGVAPAQVAKYAESMGILGIGLYETDADGYFVHLDTRQTKSFWYGQGQAYRESFGGYSLTVFIRELQKAIGAAVDGNAGQETLRLSPALGERWNNRHGAVRPVQKYLAALGYEEVGPADGVAGPKFSAALARFQRERGLADTGSLEQLGITWQTLLGMTGGNTDE